MRDVWQEEIKPGAQGRPGNADDNDHLLLLSEGRLVNLGNATDTLHALWMDRSRTRHLRKSTCTKRFADLSGDARQDAIAVEVLPKHLDEQVASYMVKGW